ncbi:MAG: phosphodiester glycosidase family protein [Candidatus Cloacimonetes bacterium]|nr:phosphodiester glycosidase family protein [Candidatus Cloacimonadota bacterium]
MYFKPFLFFICIALFARFLFWDNSSTTNKVTLSIQNTSSTLVNKLKSIQVDDKKKNKYILNFLLKRSSPYQIEYSAKTRRLSVTIFNISKKHFKKYLALNKDYFHKLHLSYSKDHIYRLVFDLKIGVFPLPYNSKGIDNQIHLGFTKSYREHLQNKPRKKIQLSGLPSISHLSNRYKREQRRKNRLNKTKVKSANISLINYQETLVEKGIVQFSFQTDTPKNHAYGFKIKKDQLKKRLDITLGKDKLLGLETLSSMSRKNNALLGINGSYFIANGDPIGLLIKDKRLLSVPMLMRSCFGLHDNGNPFIGKPEFQGEVITEKGILTIEGINQVNKSKATLLYTPEFGLKAPHRDDTIYLTIKNNRILKVSKEAHFIPKEGYVLSFSRPRFPYFADLLPMDKLVVSYGLTPPWGSASFGLGGGPSLLDNGIVKVGTDESFNPFFMKNRAPRSAIGIDSNGGVIFLVVDGRQASSVGMSLEELGHTLKLLGAREAMNLDGGGSTGLYMAGKILNKPSDGNERRISNALIIGSLN